MREEMAWIGRGGGSGQGRVNALGATLATALYSSESSLRIIEIHNVMMRSCVYADMLFNG